MSNEKEEKAKNRKIMIIFVLFLAASFVIGLLSGMISNYIQNSITDMQVIVDQVKLVMAYVIPALFLVLNLALAVIDLIYIRVCRKQTAAWDGEDEEIIDRIEKKLSISMIPVNGMLVVNFLLYSACIYLAETVELNEWMQNIMTSGGTIIFIVGFIIEIILEKKVVDLEKQLNPEKRGNVFDLKFQEVWLDSCDEAQKLMIYQAGYQAFKVTNYVCMGVWLLAFISQFMFHTGIFPVICIGIIWLVLVMTYSITSYKLETKK